MPSRGRALSECALVSSLLFLPGLAASAAPASALAWVVGGCFALYAGWAAILARRRWSLLALMLVGLAAALYATAVERPDIPPRLGVQLADEEGGAAVTQVVRGTPADGAMQVGDVVVAVEGQPLDAARPSADLRERLLDAKRLPPGDATFTVRRKGRTQDVTVKLGAVPRGPALRGADLPWILLRAAAVLLIIAAVLRLDGQSARNIGLERHGLGRELLWGVPVLVGTLAVHVTVTTPLAVLLAKAGLAGDEVSQRVTALSGLAGEVSLWQFGLSMIVVATFEEVVFRGFLLPRVRHLTGRWDLALVVVPLLFGVGHLYEGTVAVVQAAVLGLCFSAALLWRGHLGSAISAHALFNTLMFTLLVALMKSGMLEKLLEKQ